MFSCVTMGHTTQTNDHMAWTLREVNEMAKLPQYYIVEASALPEIFGKVVETKRLLETGEAVTVNQATRLTGISRSAFYKYKDAVRPFSDMLQGRIVTLQIFLKDEPGVLSAVLGVFAGSGANILTINQGIPMSGCAVVSVAAEMSGLTIAMEELMGNINEISGVLRSEVMAG
ncbi:hypothetical protein SDC9_80565 [bioreactor metagenome]|uniref:ACT domain-containing protein n=1 Tax=bioreactor metagenome TaxID=1076179 RepID=A0A644Z7B1_9ZZZZ